MQAAEAATKAGGDFCLCCFPYSRLKAPESKTVQMKTYEHCTMRRPLPHEKWEVDGKNYFLFTAADGKPKTVHRTLIRYIGFSGDKYKLNKVKWYE